MLTPCWPEDLRRWTDERIRGNKYNKREETERMNENSRLFCSPGHVLCVVRHQHDSLSLQWRVLINPHDVKTNKNHTYERKITFLTQLRLCLHDASSTSGSTLAGSNCGCANWRKGGSRPLLDKTRKYRRTGEVNFWNSALKLRVSWKYRHKQTHNKIYYKINIATISELLFYLVNDASLSHVLIQRLSVLSSVWGIFTL